VTAGHIRSDNDDKLDSLRGNRKLLPAWQLAPPRQGQQRHQARYSLAAQPRRRRRRRRKLPV